MNQVHSTRIATVAALGVLLVLWGDTGAEQEPKTGAAEELEVQVLEAQVPPGQGERNEALYRMEVLSVLRSASRVKPGDTIAVRSYTLSTEALAPGWIGVAYLNPDPKVRGPEARRQFIAADSDSLVENPPGPPALRYQYWYTPKVGGGAQ
jgi:hypothetical protein